MLGYTEPRIFSKPLRKLTPETSLGYACVEYAKEILGESLYPWQEWFLIHSLEITGDLATDWKFRFRTVLLEVSRQNGKTKVSKVIASFFLNVLGVQNVLGTSLSVDKAEEVWEAVIADQERVPDLKKEISQVARANGGKKLVLTGQRVYKVSAPTRRAGRGDSNDLVMLDEIREHRDWETWSAAVASTNAKPNGIVFCFSNAGDPDSIVLRQIRGQAIAQIEGGECANDFGGEVDGNNLGLFEWSAPEGAETDDLEALAQANPSLGYGLLTERALLSNRATFPDAKFRSECMCQQVETLLPEPFPEGAWKAGIDERSKITPESELYFGIDMSQDRKWVTIAVCGMREDGNYHVEVVERKIGIEWAVDWFKDRAPKYGKINLAFQGRGCPVSSLAEQICTIDGVERFSLEGPDLGNGWNRFYDSIAASTPIKDGETPRGGVKTFHLPQPVLDAPGRTCQLRNLGGGIQLPDRRKSPDDIAPLMACAMAFGAMTRIAKEEDKKVYQSSYASGSSLMFI